MTAGMKCPECGAWTVVLESRRPKTDNYIYRRRECGNGHRFATHEVFVKVPKVGAKALRVEQMEPISKSNRGGTEPTQSKATKAKRTT